MSDSISRQAAIRWVKTECNPYGKPTLDFESGKKVIEHLEQMPSADRPQGEWVDAEIPLESGDTMPIQVCNLCKTFYPLAYTGGGHRFCPNCGCQMKGVDDGNK